jgi:uncharacterized membrane protein
VGGEGVVGLLFLLSLAIIAGSICGIVAVVRTAALSKALAELRNRLDILSRASAKTEAPPSSPLKEEAPEKTPAAEKKVAAEEKKEKGKEEKEVGARVPVPALKAGADAPRSDVAALLESLAGAKPKPAAQRVADARTTKQDWLKSFESSIGKQWIAWAGALVLFVAAGLFVKLAIENNWIGETGRVIMGILAGLALLAGGDRFIRRDFRALGLGLVGAGLAILYVTLFYSCERVLPQSAAFGLMILVTAAGMTLAVLHDGPPLAFIAVLGGLLTPVLVSTGRDARDVLFTYLLLLDLGVLGVAFFKKWRALDVLAFIGTWILFTGWYGRFHDAVTFSLVPTLLWLGVFYLVFLVLPFTYNLRHQTTVPIERFLGSLANAVIAFSHAYWMLREDHPHTLGFLALGMSGSYIVLSTFIRRRIPKDARALFGFVAMSVVFLTLAVPLHLRMHGVTLAWAVEGPVILYLGYRFRYFPARALGLAVLACATGHLFWAHWPLHRMQFAPIFNVRFASAMIVPLAGAVYAVVHRWKREDSTPNDHSLMVACAVASAFLALVIAHSEIALSFEFSTYATRDADYARRCSTALLWALGAAGFLAAGVRARCAASRVAGLMAVFIAGILTTAAFGVRLRDEHSLFLNARFAVGLAAVLVVFAYYYFIRRLRDECSDGEQRLAIFLGWTGVLLLWLFLSVETYTYCHDTVILHSEARWVAQMALSMTWGTYAIALLAVGFWRGIRPLRLVALALFGLTALKLVLVDMSTVRQMYRVVSFLVLGILMIGTSYIYHRVEKWLEASAGKEEE